MSTVIPLRSRGPWDVLPALIVAIALGGGVTACCVAIVLGIGVEPEPAWRALLLGIAAIAAAPAVFFALRWRLLRPPAQLAVEPDGLSVAYPELLRVPLAVPRALMRVVAVEDDGPYRFRVHATSGPYVGSGDDGFLWSRGQSALPVLAPDGARPNVLLLFERPIAGADVRRARTGSIYRGEHVAGLLLAAEDAAAAERALAPLGLDRPLTMPDVFLLEEQLNAPEGGRFALGRRHIVRAAWVAIAIGAIAPVVALFGAAVGGLMIRGGARAHGAALALAGLGVCGVRLALWLG